MNASFHHAQAAGQAIHHSPPGNVSIVEGMHPSTLSGRNRHRDWRSRVHGLLWVATLALGLTTARLEAEPLTGGPYTLVGAPSGGGDSAGGQYAIRGYATSAGAGTSRGQAFELTCGLIGSYAVALGDVALSVELMSTLQARVWWPASVVGYRLEFTTALRPGAVWQPVEPPPVGNSYLAGLSDAPRFFRLRKL
jgi:hypothetical protein